MEPSTPEIVHPVAAEELPGWMATLWSTFLEDPESDRAETWRAVLEREWDPARTWGVRDRGQWVGTLRTLPRSVTVPGRNGSTAVLDADALTAVTVAGTHRRRGLLTRMLEASLRDARARGDAVSILIAAEWPIYGRFGYAPATLGARRVLHRNLPGSAVAGDPSRVRRVDRDEFASLAASVFEAARRRRAGQVDRGGAWWDRAYGLDGYPRIAEDLPHTHLIHEGDDGPDGLLAWKVSREGGLLPPRAAVKAHGPFAASDEAHRDLWAYLSGLDGVDEVETWGAVDDPVRWLLDDARTLVTTELSDFLWLRLLDVPAALSARAYSVDGELVLEVRDAGPVSVGGRYRLRAHEGRAECLPTGARADLTVGQTALASAYLGGFSLRGQLLAGGVQEHRDGALERADAMFSTGLAPVNETGF
jgi:predicted acetyltransferase